MDFTKADNHQLRVLFSYERMIPKEIIPELLNEYIQRGLLDGLIKKLIISIIPEKERKTNFADYIQEGYYAISNKLKSYDSSKSSLSKFSYMVVSHHFASLLVKTGAKKRKSNLNTFSLDNPLNNDTEDSFIDTMASNMNVEKTVINKMTIEDILDQLTDKQRETMILFAEGYSFNEIARMYNLNHVSSITKRIQAAVTRINPNQTNTIQDLGLVNYVKEYDK